MGKIYLPPKNEFTEIISAKHPCPNCKKIALVDTTFNGYDFLCQDCGEIVSYTYEQARKIVGNILLYEHISYLHDINRFNEEDWAKVDFIDFNKDNL